MLSIAYAPGSCQKRKQIGVFRVGLAGGPRLRYSWGNSPANAASAEFIVYPLESYLRDLHDIRSTGAAVKETSYYPPLANLLNAVGQTLKPRVRCIINLKNQGAGMPDGGLFTPDQLQRGADVPLEGQPPARGATECKSAKDDA